MTNKLIIAGVIVAISLGAASLFIQTTNIDLPLVVSQAVNPCKTMYDEFRDAGKAKDREGILKGIEAFSKMNCTPAQLHGWNVNPLNPCLSYWEILWQDTDGENNLELMNARSEMIYEGCFDRVDEWMPSDRPHENQRAKDVWAQVWDQWNEESRERYTRGDMGREPSVDLAKETPTRQEYEIFLDPVITRDDEDYLFKYTRITIQNTGTKPLTNVKVNYGSGDIEELGTLKPGREVIVSPPWDNLKEYVVITADEEIFMNKTYRIP